jgi:hypothetical protein
VVVHKLELNGSTVDESTDWQAGYELGAGLGFGFGPLSLTPGVSYVHHKDVSFVRADVGLRIRI